LLCEAVENFPAYFDANFALGMALYRQGDDKGALESLERA